MVAAVVLLLVGGCAVQPEFPLPVTWSASGLEGPLDASSVSVSLGSGGVGSVANLPIGSADACDPALAPLYSGSIEWTDEDERVRITTPKGEVVIARGQGKFGTVDWTTVYLHVCRTIASADDAVKLVNWG